MRPSQSSRKSGWPWIFSSGFSWIILAHCRNRRNSRNARKTLHGSQSESRIGAIEADRSPRTPGSDTDSDSLDLKGWSMKGMPWQAFARTSRPVPFNSLPPRRVAGKIPYGNYPPWIAPNLPARRPFFVPVSFCDLGKRCLALILQCLPRRFRRLFELHPPTKGPRGPAMNCSNRLCTAAWPVAGLLVFAAAGRAAPVEFDRDIRPILAENCFACHGPDASARKAGCGSISATSPSKRAIVPGKPDESGLIQRICSDDPKELMPPAKSNKKLTPNRRNVAPLDRRRAPSISRTGRSSRRSGPSCRR